MDGCPTETHNFIGLVYMVPIDAHSVSATMRITTTCSLNAPILKHNFQEWQRFINVLESFSYKDSLIILATKGKKD